MNLDHRHDHLRLAEIEIPLTVDYLTDNRKRTLILYPIAQSEFLGIRNRLELRQTFEGQLIFGAYPEVITAQTRKSRIDLVSEIANSYQL